MFRLFMLSDARSFTEASSIVADFDPDVVVMLGDLLYDGPGQEYVLDPDGAAEVEACSNTRVFRLCDGRYVVRGYASMCKTLYRIHLNSFMDLLSDLAFKGIRVYIVPGNHDYDVDYEKLVADSLGREAARSVAIVRRPTAVTVGGFRIVMLPYQTSLRYPIQLLTQSDIIATHAELRQLRRIVALLAEHERERLLVSGHNGIGYYPPGRLAQALTWRGRRALGWKPASSRTHLVRIDSFPYSYLVIDLEEATGRIYGRLEATRRIYSFLQGCGEIVTEKRVYEFTVEVGDKGTG